MELAVAVMIGLPVLYIGLDIVLALNSTQGDTYSEILRNTGRKFQPLIMIMCFSMGLLAGHWFWLYVLVITTKAGNSGLA